MPGDMLQVITQVGLLVFVVSGMASMGLELTVHRIVAPLRDGRLVISLLVANFVVVPAVAVAMTRLLPMEPEAETAVVLIGCVSGAPFIPKLTQLARGDTGLGVGVMFLLMVVTVGYAPIVVPLAVTGAVVDALAIALSLIVLMLLPLALGLLLRARRPSLAVPWAGRTGFASTAGLLLGSAAAILATWREALGAVGTLIFAGAAVVLVASLAAGWLAGLGRPAGDRTVTALATGQRNVAAAIVIAPSIGGDTPLYTLLGALVITALLIVLARSIGWHRGSGTAGA